MTRTASALALTGLLALAACATPESRIRTALTDAGLPKQTASCMADRMVDKLSVAQLIKLQRISKATDKGLRNLTLKQFGDLVRRAGDPEILAITTRAGLSCAVLGG
jgi:hypothetical protein